MVPFGVVDVRGDFRPGVDPRPGLNLPPGVLLPERPRRPGELPLPGLNLPPGVRLPDLFGDFDGFLWSWLLLLASKYLVEETRVIAQTFSSNVLGDFLS